MLDERSKYLRRLVIRMVEGYGRGHIGPALSLIEVLRVLYDSVLKYDARETAWIDRDRFILSKGHGCLALYAILADKGFFSLSELDGFCKPSSILGGHPEMRKVPGVEASTGSLGHGLPIGVGMALAAKIAKKTHRVIVALGDGEMNEGSIWESALSAAKHKLSNLTVLIDCNKLQSYGSTADVLDMSPLLEKWKSFGFCVAEVDGHSIEELQNVFCRLPLSPDSPTAIVCHTVKGKGIAIAEGNPLWHHKSGLKPSDFSEIYNFLS